jgi:hypothetical protein
MSSTSRIPIAEDVGLELESKSRRILPPNRLYLPPPSINKSGGSIARRMRREVILSFSKSVVPDSKNRFRRKRSRRFRDEEFHPPSSGNYGRFSPAESPLSVNSVEIAAEPSAVDDGFRTRSTTKASATKYEG